MVSEFGVSTLVGEGVDERLTVRGDRYLGVGVAGLRHGGHRKDPPTFVGVVVQDVEHGRPPGPSAECVGVCLWLLLLLADQLLVDGGCVCGGVFDLLPVVYTLQRVEVENLPVGDVVEQHLAAVDSEDRLSQHCARIADRQRHRVVLATGFDGHAGGTRPRGIRAVPHTDRSGGEARPG